MVGVGNSVSKMEKVRLVFYTVPYSFYYKRVSLFLLYFPQYGVHDFQTPCIGFANGRKNLRSLKKIKFFLVNLKPTEEQMSSNILKKHKEDILLNASR